MPYKRCPAGFYCGKLSSLGVGGFEGCFCTKLLRGHKGVLSDSDTDSAHDAYVRKEHVSFAPHPLAKRHLSTEQVTCKGEEGVATRLSRSTP